LKYGILTIKLFVGFCPFCFCCQVAKFVNQKNDLDVDWYEPKWNECPCYRGFLFSNIWEVVLGKLFSIATSSPSPSRR
jgi:hypothetical protein